MKWSWRLFKAKSMHGPVVGRMTPAEGNCKEILNAQTMHEGWWHHHCQVVGKLRNPARRYGAIEKFVSPTVGDIAPCWKISKSGRSCRGSRVQCRRRTKRGQVATGSDEVVMWHSRVSEDVAVRWGGQIWQWHVAEDDTCHSGDMSLMTWHLLTHIAT